jgi:hypothetical protein
LNPENHTHRVNVLSDVKIFRISIGPDPKDGMSYFVGQKIHTGSGNNRDDCVITRIVRNENNFYLFGNMAYIIYAKRNDSGKEFVFRFCENMPVYVTGVTPNSEMEKKVDEQFINYENPQKHLPDPG